ncbi:MAG: microcin C transport system substrate-binding protein [Oleiphilaceae bacterium]|jgi:microcin C transport system substrate-binding protein
MNLVKKNIILLIILCFSAWSHAQNLTTQHGFALHGDLKYPLNFKHFDYVNPNAPKTGTLNLMGFGTFDSLNPYTLKGTSPFNTAGQFIYGFSELNETLLIGTGSYSPSGDEPQSAYGLLAESLTYPDDMKWVEFKIRPNAYFHDGHKIDADDVVYSFRTLIEKGHPRFQQSLFGVASISTKSSNVVRVDFKEANQRANILRVGEMPVLPKHFWEFKEFERSAQTKPLLSGPYEVDSFDIGNTITLKRNPNFWGRELNVYQGRFNFDNIKVDYYRDQSIAFEAFKAGNFDLFYDYMAKNWASAYDFPAVKSGKVLKEEINHQIPSTTQGFFFNSRIALFEKIKVRQALSLMFDYEWTNKALFNQAYVRNQSYFPNSDFSARGLPQNEELALLEPYRSSLPPELFNQPFRLSSTSGNGNIRKQIKQALQLLKEAGWIIKNGQLTNTTNKKIFQFEILIRQTGIQRLIMPFIKNLERIGITATARLVDSTQYKVRMDNFDFDMTTYSLSQGNAPSYEQRDYFHSSNVDTPGSQNYSGVNHPAVDALVNSVISAKGRPELISAMRALDRVLLWNHYTIPNWHLDYHRLASWDKFERPKNQPIYKLAIENWWLK